MIRWNRIEAPKEFFANPPGRLIATVAGTHAESVTSFRFSPSDTILFGSESRGLPTEVVSASAASLTIPAYGRTQSLNLAVAVSVVLYEYRRHLGKTSDS